MENLICTFLFLHEINLYKWWKRFPLSSVDLAVIVYLPFWYTLLQILVPDHTLLAGSLSEIIRVPPSFITLLASIFSQFFYFLRSDIDLWTNQPVSAVFSFWIVFSKLGNSVLFSSFLLRQIEYWWRLLVNVQLILLSCNVFATSLRMFPLKF